MADKKNNKNLVIEDARLIFRNFSGKEGKYNPPGKRNFCVLIDNKEAKKLEKDGWNIRYLRPREEGDEEQAYLQVAVEYKNIPPQIVLITRKGKTILQEEDVNMLDWAEIETADLIIRPYNWEVNDKKGTKAYCKTLYITIVEDEFAAKYDDLEGSASAPKAEPIDDEEVPF